MSNSYEVRLQGVVSARILGSLSAGQEIRADTILHGDIQDQAALHGLLARISDLGLELVDVQRIQHDPPRER
jgi:hypothetical protein